MTTQLEAPPTNSLELTTDTRIGFAFAHPDDELLTAAALREAALLYKAGQIAAAHVLYASNGEAGRNSGQRMREVMASLGYLGVDLSRSENGYRHVHFAGRPDGGLAYDPGLHSAAADFIAKNALTDVVVLGRPDDHPDHQAVSRAVLDVAGPDTRALVLNHKGNGGVRVSAGRRSKLEVMSRHPGQFTARPWAGQELQPGEELRDGHVIDGYTADVLDNQYAAFLEVETYDAA